MSSCRLTGPLPDSFQYNTFLLQANLGRNYFNGTIPRGLLQLTQLTNLQLYDNLFVGTIPNAE